VTGTPVGVEPGEAARLGGRLSGLFSDGFQGLDLHELGFFVGEHGVYALHVVVR
jgi:hypothetical protein